MKLSFFGPKNIILSGLRAHFAPLKESLSGFKQTVFVSLNTSFGRSKFCHSAGVKKYVVGLKTAFWGLTILICPTRDVILRVYRWQFVDLRASRCGSNAVVLRL